jgi:DNA-nicking Smr family endonuclease
MNVGDHVRALHSDEEGFVTKIIDERTIEIEIEDGFTILLMKRDVVIVKKEESEFFKQSPEENSSAPIFKKNNIHLGVYIAFIPTSENFVDPYFINNTEYELLLTAHSISANDVKGVFSNKIPSKSYVDMNKWNIKDFEQRNDLQLNLLYYKTKSTTYREPLSKKIKFQAKAFFKSFKQVPLIDQKGYLYQIDQNAEKITPNLFTSDSNEINDVDVPEAIIDLHADQLPNAQQIPSVEILNEQLQLFQKKLDAAVATNMTEITFIHGNGNGVLRSKIQKNLSEHSQVAYYQDAQKNKFGYGATYVKIK